MFWQRESPGKQQLPLLRNRDAIKSNRQDYEKHGEPDPVKPYGLS